MYLSDTQAALGKILEIEKKNLIIGDSWRQEYIEREEECVI